MVSKVFRESLHYCILALTTVTIASSSSKEVSYFSMGSCVVYHVEKCSILITLAVV